MRRHHSNSAAAGDSADHPSFLQRKRTSHNQFPDKTPPWAAIIMIRGIVIMGTNSRTVFKDAKNYTLTLKERYIGT